MLVVRADASLTNSLLAELFQRTPATKTRVSKTWFQPRRNRYSARASARVRDPTPTPRGRSTLAGSSPLLCFSQIFYRFRQFSKRAIRKSTENQSHFCKSKVVAARNPNLDGSLRPLMELFSSPQTAQTSLALVAATCCSDTQTHSDFASHDLRTRFQLGI
jgi:hypothetical protein